mmetsp:Transcript_15082/g.33923  ORF Transcript_15082/g.33923 Transcript_15082/m.33923 type:complete len:228 (-) Transcript_15082:160-843(-)
MEPQHAAQRRRADRHHALRVGLDDAGRRAPVAVDEVAIVALFSRVPHTVAADQVVVFEDRGRRSVAPGHSGHGRAAGRVDDPDRKGLICFDQKVVKHSQGRRARARGQRSPVQGTVDQSHICGALRRARAQLVADGDGTIAWDRQRDLDKRRRSGALAIRRVHNAEGRKVIVGDRQGLVDDGTREHRGCCLHTAVRQGLGQLVDIVVVEHEVIGLRPIGKRREGKRE